MYNIETRSRQDSHRQDFGTEALSVLRRGQEVERQKAASTEAQIVFARGRIRAILAGIERESRRCDDIERGREILAVLLPYVFESYTLEDDASYIESRALVSYWLPGIMADLGADGYGKEWDRLAEERSVAVAAQHANPAHRGKPVNWLPRAAEITALFELSREDRDAINERQTRHGGKRAMIGIPVTDPFNHDERKERQRACMTAKRRRDGVKAQSARTITKTLQTYADLSGVSIDTIKRHRKKGTLEAFLSAKGISA